MGHIEPVFGEGLARTLEALSAANLVAWRWDATQARLHLTGAVAEVGLSPLAPICGSSALLALVCGSDRAAASELFKINSPGARIFATLLIEGAAGARATVWRGAWLEDGDAAGVVGAADPMAAGGVDALTGLLDRRAFMARVEERLRRPGRIGVIAADLARLRRLNEALGPSGADLVLRALGARIAAAFPKENFAARIGEDEFALLVEEGPDTLGAAQALRLAVERPMRVRGFDIHPSLWIAEAFAEGGPTGPAAEELMRRSALALDAAKSAGANPMRTTVQTVPGDGLSRLALEADLHGAIERGEIMPYYQPIAHLGTGRLAGFEALARWRHPTRGLIQPDEFLPLLADAGLMTAIGRHMLATSAAQIALWRRTHPAAGELFVAVNLSTGELDDERLVGFLAEQIRINGLAPRALKVEITESDVMRDPERAAVVLAELRKAGAGISLDDFGTGFSSLSYLTRLPFETLKIDRYFVRTMGENEGSAKIVRSVASLGRDLGLEVVAEGVETLASARQLHAMGCEFGQGFGYAPALDASAAEVYLHESYLDNGAPIKISA